MTTCPPTAQDHPAITNALASSRVQRVLHSWTALAIVCVALWLAVRCLFFVGFEGSDDMFYVRFANLWHRTPANQWEVRLLANALISLSMRVFGYHEWSAALPALLASLTVLCTALLSCRLYVTIRHAWWAGLFVALVPLEVTNATTVSAHAVMVGFMAVGTLALIRAPDSRRATVIAATCLPLGVIAHWNGSHYVATAILAALLVDWRRYARPVAYVCLGGIVFMLADMLVFHVLFGDALCRWRICASGNIVPEDFGAGGPAWLQMALWSLQQSIAGKPFGIALIVTLVGAGVQYRRLARPLRVLFWITLLFWLQINFGSYVPWNYRPFWRNTRYMHPLIMPAAVLFATVLADARNRRLARALGTVSLFICLALLGTGGTWGQSIQVSRELLAYALRYPEQRFVADVSTLNEIYVLNALKTPANIVGTTDMGRTHFLDPAVKRVSTLSADACDAVLINPLNVERTPTFAALVNSHLGPLAYETQPQIRPICRLIPPLASTKWAIRRPAAQVYTLAPTHETQRAAGFSPRGTTQMVVGP